MLYWFWAGTASSGGPPRGICMRRPRGDHRGLPRPPRLRPRNGRAQRGAAESPQTRTRVRAELSGQEITPVYGDPHGPAVRPDPDRGLPPASGRALRRATSAPYSMIDRQHAVYRPAGSSTSGGLSGTVSVTVFPAIMVVLGAGEPVAEGDRESVQGRLPAHCPSCSASTDGAHGSGDQVETLERGRLGGEVPRALIARR